MIDANVTHYGEDLTMMWVDEVVGETDCGLPLYRIVDEYGNNQGSATMEIIRDARIPQVEFA